MRGAAASLFQGAHPKGACRVMCQVFGKGARCRALRLTQAGPLTYRRRRTIDIPTKESGPRRIDSILLHSIIIP